MVLFSGQNIITPKAEKGGAVVIVDVDDYENKANFTMLSTKIQIDLTEIYHLKVNKKTEELKSLHHLDEKTAKKLKHHHLQ